MLYVFLTLFAAAIVALDQWTKALAAAQLTDVVDVLIPGWLELRYTTNDGMALSMLSGARWLFVVVGVLFVALVVWAVAKKHITKKPELWCIAAITGGGGRANAGDICLFAVVFHVQRRGYFHHRPGGAADLVRSHL